MSRRNAPPAWLAQRMQTGGAQTGQVMMAAPSGQPGLGPPPYSPWISRRPWPGPSPYPYAPAPSPYPQMAPSFPCLDAYPPLRDEFWRYINDRSIPARVLYSVADYLMRAGCSNEAAFMMGEARRRDQASGGFSSMPPWFRRQQTPGQYDWFGNFQPYEVQQQGNYQVFVEPAPTVKGTSGWGIGQAQPKTCCVGCSVGTGCSCSSKPSAQTGACGPQGCPGGVCPIR